jgi:shikimate dehydrogenase
VTIPYKQAAYRICRELSSAARRSGVVNALSCDVHGTIAGHNTDVGGLQIVLSEMADAMPYDSVLIVGGGGAARAAIVATQFRFPQARITLAARSRLAEIKQDFPNIHIKNLSEHDPDLSAYSLIIQCTPVGGTVQTGMPLSGELKFRPGATVLDLIYAPRETEFLRCARKQGAITTNGLTMLLGQALQAFQWWTGAALPLHAARAELIPQLTEL